MKAANEKHRNERHPAHELDVARGHGGNGRHLAASPEREQNAERHGCSHAHQRKHNRKRQAAPHVGGDALKPEHAAEHQNEEEDDGGAPEHAERAQIGLAPHERKGAHHKHGKHNPRWQRRHATEGGTDSVRR